MQPSGAIVIGGYVNGLGVVRALAARGVRVAVVRTKPYDIAQHSRFAAASADALDVEEHPEQLVELLERRAAEWGGSVLMPVNDGALAALAAYRDRLATRYRVVAPPAEVARWFLDKEIMLEAARAAGIPTPRCYGRAADVAPGDPELRFPVVVKPITSHRFSTRFGTKLFLAGDPGELARGIAAVAAAGLPCQVFDLVPGGDDHLYTYSTHFDARGEPQGGVTVRKVRQSPPGFGVARVAEVVDDVPELREATIALVRRLGHRGQATAEFKRDPRDGSFRFIEVNGRSILYNSLLRRAGLDLAGLAWSEAVHGRAEPVRTNGWRGVWIELHADLLYSLLHRRQHRVGLVEFLTPYRRPGVSAVWMPSDPAPFLAQWSRTARAAGSALRAGGRRAIVADRARVPVSA